MKTLDKNQLDAVQAMVAHIVAECSVVDTDRLYDKMLDECYSFDKVGGIFACMSPSRVLAEVDPVAYRCGKNDWLDGEDLVEVGNDYFRVDEVDEAKEQFIDALRDELSTLEDERDEYENQDGEQIVQSDLDKFQCDIDAKQSQIDACENHSF